MSEINDSILDSVKKLTNTEGDEYFDSDLIMHINSVFSILTQMGVGPKEGFTISDNTKTWDEFTNEEPVLNMVKTYMAIKVKLLFDISTASSYYIDTLKKQCDEFEWRLHSEFNYHKEES